MPPQSPQPSLPESAPARGADGQFAKGSSGNKKGRPRRSERIPHPEVFRDLGYAIAEYKVSVKLDGKEYKVPLVQANLMTLAIKGANGDPDAARQFLTKIDASVQDELREMRDGVQRLSRGEPDFVRETDPVKRKALFQKWQYALDAVTGRRQRMADRFPPPKRPRRRRKPRS